MAVRTIFRRVRGRIIPIKVSAEAKDIAAGFAGFAGSGIAAAGARRQAVGK